ncbi:MAG: RNA polymerase sigma factor [Planctomycetota bacterium]
MVYGVCRRLLRDSHLAEDAFQQTMLALARNWPSAPCCWSACCNRRRPRSPRRWCTAPSTRPAPGDPARPPARRPALGSGSRSSER